MTLVPRHAELDFDALRLRARRDMALKGRAASLYEDILDLSLQRGYCWKDNAQFAEEYGVTKDAVKAWMRSLKASGYLVRKLVDGQWRTYPTAPEVKREGVTDFTPQGVTDVPQGVTDDPQEGVTDVTHTIDHKNSPSGSRERRARARAAFGQLAGVEAIEVYAEVTGLVPAVHFAEQIAATVGAGADDLDVWREVCLTWTATHDPDAPGKPYRLTNVRRMLGHYREIHAESDAHPRSHSGNFRSARDEAEYWKNNPSLAYERISDAIDELPDDALDPRHGGLG